MLEPSFQKLLDKTQASKFLQISPRLLEDPAWRARYAIPTIRVGGALRFDARELRQWLAQRREPVALNTAAGE